MCWHAVTETTNPLFTVIPLLHIIIKITKTKFYGHIYPA